MNLLKSLGGAGKKREASGPLTGRTLPLGEHTVKVEAVIGEGGFATIYRTVDINTQATFALKHFMLSGDEVAERDVHTEVAVMRALSSCPHILNLRGAALGKGEAFLLLDFCQGTLAGLMMDRSLSDNDVRAVFLPVARAISALHAMNPPMAHRDVKAENILRKTDGAWVLCDFGSATSEQKVYSSPAEIAREEDRIRKQTTPAYRAPELWDLYTREFIGTAVDVWSLGVLLYFIAYGKLPFDGEAKLQILNGKYSEMSGRRPVGVEQLIAAMLVVDPKGRITAAEVAARAENMLMMNGGGGGGGGGDQGGVVQNQFSAPPRAVSQQQRVHVQRVVTSSNTNVAPPPAQVEERAAEIRPSTSSLAAAAAAPTAFSDDAWGLAFNSSAAQQQQHLSGGDASGSGGNWADFGAANFSPQPPSTSTATTTMSTNTSRDSFAMTGGSSDTTTTTITNYNSSSRPGSAFSEPPRRSVCEPPPPSISGGSGSGRSSAASLHGPVAVAPAAQLPLLHQQQQSVDAERTELHEHCQVLEQLLDERMKEIGTLRAELDKQQQEKVQQLQQEQERNASNASASNNISIVQHEKAQKEILALKDAAAASATEMQRVRDESARVVSQLRLEMQQLRARAEKAEAEVLRLKNNSNNGGGNSKTFSRSTSALASFPLHQTEVTSGAVRPGSGAGERQQRNPEPAMLGVAGRQNSFFKDLNPLK